jgi:hypothetical protein
MVRWFSSSLEAEELAVLGSPFDHFEVVGEVTQDLIDQGVPSYQIAHAFLIEPQIPISA